jgi:hypothetical protein
MKRNDSSRVGHLNQALSSALEAAESYEFALSSGGIDEVSRQTLLFQLGDHLRRARDLRREMRELGSEPDSSSETWNRFARLIGSDVLDPSDLGETDRVSEPLDASLSRQARGILRAYLTTHHPRMKA